MCIESPSFVFEISSPGDTNNVGSPKYFKLWKELNFVPLQELFARPGVVSEGLKCDPRRAPMRRKERQRLSANFCSHCRNKQSPNLKFQCRPVAEPEAAATRSIDDISPRGLGEDGWREGR
jgi:hypothetical protein